MKSSTYVTIMFLAWETLGVANKDQLEATVIVFSSNFLFFSILCNAIFDIFVKLIKHSNILFNILKKLTKILLQMLKQYIANVKWYTLQELAQLLRCVCRWLAGAYFIYAPGEIIMLVSDSSQSNDIYENTMGNWHYYENPL